MWKFTSYIMYKEHHRVRVKFQRESRGAQESYTSSSYHVRVTTVRSQLVCSLSHLSDSPGGGVPVWPMSPFTTSCQVDFDEELFYMDNCGYLTVLYICNAFNICIMTSIFIYLFDKTQVNWYLDPMRVRGGTWNVI